jgi:hypothetical protein
MSLYDTDFFAWTHEMAQTLRAGGRLDPQEACLVAEELEDVGRSEKRSLRSAIAQLYMHLLKQRYQPERQTVTWEVSIEKQRDEIEELIGENRSLGPLLNDAEFLARAYRRAVQDAVKETELPKAVFPETSPFTYEDFGLPPMVTTTKER